MKEKRIQITRKFAVRPIGDKEEVSHGYNFIRNGMKVQARMQNLLISALHAAENNGATKEEQNELIRKYTRIPSEKNKESSLLYGIIKEEEYPTGICLGGYVGQETQRALKKARKEGLSYGKVSLPSFRDNNPMYVQKDLLLPDGDPNKKRPNAGLKNNYETMEALEHALLKEGRPNVTIKFCNDITFEVVFGNPYKGAGLRKDMIRIFSGEYKVCDSEIGIDKNNKIQLYLSLSIPVRENTLDENVRVGVDLGITVPAVCALNNNIYKRELIGSYEEFVGYQTKRRKMRSRIQSELKMAHGGKGKQKKLAHQEKYDHYVANFSKTYNHKISKQIVQFALKNNAGVIQLEDLSGIKQRDSENKEFKAMLQNWSIYDLQQDIIYKAAREGIQVRFVKPAYTSQTCSVCGHVGMRPKQDTFICSNPECNCKQVYEKFGKHFADFNAARNIAMSEEYVAEKENKKKAKTTKVA